ncbi:MAG: hypothetical protein FVQ79_08110 [Planctomycetes bacterium]|nr:hypothetical protein [Planctomycetota bacterium]
MSKTTVCLLSMGVFFVLFAGCAPEVKDVDEPVAVKADISLKYVPGQVATYRSASEMTQEVIFEQPALKKTKVDRVNIQLDIKFDQVIETVNADGSAIAKITFKDIRVYREAPKGVSIDFDSNREEDKKDSAYNLIGKSYTVKLMPDGKASSVDTKDAMAAIKGIDAAEIAKALLNEKEISKRHGIPGIPTDGLNKVSAGDNWYKISIGHELLLPPKSFKKTYTVSNIEGKDGKKMIHVSMEAAESAESAEDAGEVSPIAAFLGPMVDGAETYSGDMTFDSSGGLVADYDEKLVANYATTGEAMGVAIGVAAKENPDMIKFNLIYSISLESVK